MSIQDSIKKFKEKMANLGNVATSNISNNSNIVNGDLIAGSHYQINKNAQTSPVVEVKKTLAREFTKLEFHVPFNLVIDNKPSQEIILQVEEHVLKNIEIDLVGEVLKIKTKGNFQSQKLGTIYVSSSTITHAEFSGVGSVEGNITTPNIKINHSGVGSLELGIKSQTLIIDKSGTGEALIKGITEKMILDLSGTGKFDAKDLPCETIKIDISGVAGVKLHAHKYITGNMSGVGNLEVYGNGQIDIENNGLGSIKRKTSSMKI